MAPKENLHLYSSWFCPFAQRSWIALEEKQLPFTYHEVNPYESPAELVRANPRSTVPAIEHEGVGTMGESLVINEYLDQAFPSSKQLLPNNALQRAHCRIFIDGVVTKQIVPGIYRLLKERGEERKKTMERFEVGLREVAEQLEKSGGPFLFGAEFGAADVALAPFIPLRCSVLKQYADYDPIEVVGSQKLKDWCKRVKMRPSVIKTLADEEKLTEAYKRYADGTATSKVAQAIKQGLPLP